MSTAGRFAAWGAVLEVGGCADAAAVPPIPPERDAGAQTVLAGPREGYGDGEPIEQEVMDRIIATQWEIAVAVPLRNGDVLCIHNLTCQHGRLPCAEDANRRVFVSLATPQPGSFHV